MTDNKKIDSKYKEIVKEGLCALNKKNMALILHGVSFPSLKEKIQALVRIIQTVPKN